jgi:hypothetical protein
MSGLRLPALAVRLMLGKNAARAAPMLALAAFEQVLGFLDVRATLEDVRRQAGRYFGQLVGIELQWLGQVGRNAGAQQHGQAVDVLGDQALVLRVLDPRAFYGGAGLAEVECRATPTSLLRRVRL